MCMVPFMGANPRYPLWSKEPRVPFPCGRCPDCLVNRSSDWCFRLSEHSKVSTTSYFITLTYDNENVPVSRNGFLSLDRKAFPKAIRSYRKRLRDKSVKLQYYHVGEYGSKNHRPHYHAIVFNLPDVVYLTTDDKGMLYHSPIFDLAWPYGRIDIRQCNDDTIAYCCKYLHKGKSVPAHRNDDRVPEFSTMSNGLGKAFLDDISVVSWYRINIDKVFVVSNGFKKRMPRYYRERIYNCPIVKLVQSMICEDRFVVAEQLRLQEYIARHGSHGGYTKSNFEARKAAIVNFKSRAKMSRSVL